MVIAAAAAWGLFILSGGLYAGTTGVVRGVFLAAGLVAVAVGVALLGVYA